MMLTRLRGVGTRLEAGSKCYRITRAESSGEAEMHHHSAVYMIQLYRLNRAEAFKRGRRTFTKMHTPGGAHAHISSRLASLLIQGEGRLS